MTLRAHYRLFRLRLHRRLVVAARKRQRAFLVSKQEAKRFDERSTMDRFRRENGRP